MGFKSYLGDSVYVETDNTGGLILTTENGYPTDPSNVIYLEPEVLDALFRYVARMEAMSGRGVCNGKVAG